VTVAANDKKGRRRRLPSNANPRLPSRAWTLNRPSGQQGEPAWITRRRQAHHLTAPGTARTVRDTTPTRHPNRKRSRMTDYPRPGYYHAPDYIRTAARDKAGRAVRDMVLRLSGDPRTCIELPPPAQHTADLAGAHPLATLEAAAELEEAAHDLVAEQIRLARQVGRTWYQIADALHLHALACANKESAADEAFSYALKYHSIANHHDITWTCPACQQPITDHGPWDELPQQEDGHTPDCPRRTAELAAWQTRKSHS
jgi:hypothetical protein